MDTLRSKDGRMNLFCIPFAGGSSYSYRDLQKVTASFLRVFPVELPGRGRRFSEPLLTDIHDMVRDALSQMMPEIEQPYAIFGHSLGATVGYLLARRIVDENLSPPVHLFLSGCAGPSRSREKKLHLLSQEEFRDMLSRFEGTPAEVLNNSVLMELFEPIVRADFQAVDSYVYEVREPFDIPITVLTGHEDHMSSHGAIRWQEVTTREVTLREFPGGHFFIFSHLAELGRIFSASCSSYQTENRENDQSPSIRFSEKAL